MSDTNAERAPRPPEASQTMTTYEILDAIPGAFERHEHGRADLPNAGPDPSRIAEPPHSRVVRPPADRRLRE